MVVVPGVKQVQGMLAGRGGGRGTQQKKSGGVRRDRVQYSI